MPYLSCPGKTLHKICDQSYRKVNFYDLQDAVGEEIQKYLDTIEERRQEKLNENRKLESRRDELKKELENLIQLAAKGGLTAEVIQSAIEERQTEINSLELQIQMNITAVDILKINISTNAELNFYHGPQEHIDYESLLTDQKKEIIKLLIDKIILSADGTFKIIWNI